VYFIKSRNALKGRGAVMIDFTHPLTEDEHQKLDLLYTSLEEESTHFAGYPCNLNFDYSELYRFLEFSMNNIGDPFKSSNFHISTHALERDVIEQFAKWNKADIDDMWGYVTNGGTEGNMYGLYLARELYPNGIVYFSEDTHYSVEKILHLLKIKNITIRSQENGEIDYDDLHETIKSNRDVPSIIFANIGTTVKGAVDDIAKINEIMKSLAITHNYIHVDCALSGMILPFVDDPQAFSFEDGIESLSISGHKLTGSPIPCGIVLAKKSNVERIGREIEYVGVMDTTIMGSRNAFTPIILWYALRRHGFEGFQNIVRYSIELADYCIECFQKHGINAWRNKNSITVVFPRPSDKAISYWQIAAYKEIAHIITLPHHTKEKICHIVNEVVDSYKSMEKSSHHEKL